jgi:general L-amino acid transport system substrate-binding protein
LRAAAHGIRRHGAAEYGWLSLRVFCAAFAALVAPPAHAESTLDRIRQAGSLTCAAEARPGFAEEVAEGRITGLAVDLCRAIAIAVLGPSANARITLPDADGEFAAIGGGGADVVFASPEIIAEHHLDAELIPGPTVFVDPITLMVPESSSARAPTDLAGHIVCLMIGDPAQRAVESVLGSLAPPIARLTFREDVEMLDAYNVGRCEALAGDATALAQQRRSGGVNRLRSRILQPPLTVTPLLAATPVRDGAWAALVGWLLPALIADAAPPSAWRAPIAMSTPGVRPTWRDDIRAALGSYADMRERNLGAHSPLALPPWPNAPWPDGLLIGSGGP